MKVILQNLVFSSTGLPLDELPRDVQEEAIVESFQDMIEFASNYVEEGLDSNEEGIVTEIVDPYDSYGKDYDDYL
ncbi:hypothetical protein HC766_04555 [Candidatus Gracilibacteria bacterium]|nr:hypothetical protein [Candidatus Gracilibacteria bacterium]